MALIEADIRQEWEQVRPGLSEICQQGGGMIPEDYYALVVSAQASVFMDEQKDGFTILSVAQIRDGPSGHPYNVLRVLACWSKAGNARKTYLHELDDMARKTGCRFLEFDSTRKGFLKDSEWFLDKMVFRRKVENHGEEQQ